MSSKRVFSLLALSTVIVLHPRVAGAQALAKVTSVRCTFTLMAQSSLKDEPPKAEIKPYTRVLEFSAINTDEGTAELKSDVGGAYDIIVRYAQGYLNFIQSFREGPVYITTILEQKTKTGKFKAVHSRHEYTPVALPTFTSSPEQYYGECEILN